MPETDTPDIPAEAPVAPEPDPALGTFVTRDGRVVRLSMSERGEITLLIGGRGQPVAFDRWQSLSLLALFAEHA
jgi:hypothetical protein